MFNNDNVEADDVDNRDVPGNRNVELAQGRRVRQKLINQIFIIREELANKLKSVYQ